MKLEKLFLALLSVFLALPIYAASPAQCDADARAALALASADEPAVIVDMSMLELLASQIGANPGQVTRTLLQDGDDIILQECNGQNCTRQKIGTISGLLAAKATATPDAKAAAALASPGCPCPCGCAITGICTCGKTMQSAPVQTQASVTYATTPVYSDVSYTQDSGSGSGGSGRPCMPIRHVIGRRLFPNMAAKRGW